MLSLEQRLKQHAKSLGFDLVGIAPATEADHFDQFLDWLDHEYAGEMDYLQRYAEAHRRPTSILPEVRSVIMVAMNYKPEESGCPDPGEQREPIGKIARYARGADYHDVLRQRLKQLLEWLQNELPDCRGRAVVDTAPLLERDFARRAGLGWFGKNTMLLNKKLGSYFFLGGLLVNVPLHIDLPHLASHCGTCTACLDACPTEAFVAPGTMDARRCISYLTIELKTATDPVLRPAMAEWVFGCDICQEVCPWNCKAPPAREPAFLPRPELNLPNLLEWFTLSEEEFRHRFRGTALSRPKRAGLLRNAAIAMGNRGDPTALPILRRVAEQDPEPLVREAAQWAVERIQFKYSPSEAQETNSGKK